MADMLSRARFKDESDMISKDENVTLDFFKATQLSAKDRGTPTLHAFNENEYEGEWLLIGRFLRTMMEDASWTKEEALQNMKESLLVLFEGRIPLAASKEKDMDSTTSSGEER